MRKYIRRTCVVFAVTILAACGSREELASGLNNQQSIDLLVSLRNAGLNVERSKQSSGRNVVYNVYVHASERERAMQIIHDQKLLAPQEAGIESESRAEFSPVARELANLRLDRALAVEAERLLSTLPGMVESRVSIRSFFVHGLSASSVSEQPRATVILRFSSRAGNQLFQDADVRRILAQVVPGIRPEAITITSLRFDTENGSTDLFANGESGEAKKSVELASLGVLPIEVPVSQKTRTMFVLSMLGAVVLFLGALIGAALVWRQRGKAKAVNLTTASVRAKEQATIAQRKKG